MALLRSFEVGEFDFFHGGSFLFATQSKIYRPVFEGCLDHSLICLGEFLNPNKLSTK